MPEQTEPEPSPPTTRLSKTLAVVVVALLVLPFVVSWPAHQLMVNWLRPQLNIIWLVCLSDDCPAALDLERRGIALSLAPSLLFALLSILLGAIGLIRMCWHPPSRKHVGLYAASLIGGVIWVGILAEAWNIFANIMIYL